MWHRCAAHAYVPARSKTGDRLRSDLSLFQYQHRNNSVWTPPMSFAERRAKYFTILFFCSRNCCLCAVHQSVKELRHAKKQRETRNKQPKTGKQTHKPNKQKPNKKNNTRTPQPRQIPLQPVRHVRRVRRSPHRTGETRGSMRP